MSQVEVKLAILITDGVRFSVNGDNLVVDSPSGILTPETKATIRFLKPEIIHLLRQYGDDVGYYNRFAEAYNDKIDSVLNEADIFGQFNVLLNERIAVMTLDGNLSEEEAEKIATKLENLMQIVLSL